MKIIFPKDQTIEHPERSILTIYTAPDCFSFSVYDPNERGSYFYKELRDRIQTDAFTIFKEAFFDNPFFSLPFRKVWIMSRTTIFTFIPNSNDYNESQEDFLDFLFSERQGISLSQNVSSTGVKVLYQLPEEIYWFMLRSFADPVFIHYSSPLITYFREKVEKANVHRMVVNLQEKGVDIFCFSDELFLLGNHFPCNGLSEALYYILFTWKQLQFSQLNDYLHITGNSIFKEEAIIKLAPYLQHIYCLFIFPEIHFEEVETETIPFELASLSICEL